jgi:hypothetical protein
LLGREEEADIFKGGGSGRNADRCCSRGRVKRSGAELMA